MTSPFPFSDTPTFTYTKMSWHKEGNETFQSAIKPVGVDIVGDRSLETNLQRMHALRDDVRQSLNNDLCYGQRDRRITINNRKQS